MTSFRIGEYSHAAHCISAHMQANTTHARNWSCISDKQARRQDVTAGGQKPGGGGNILEYSIGCMQQPVGQTWNGEAPISNGGAGHHWPPRWRRAC